ncbi:hypothetical protein C8R44DRAFT_725359 [Mycena epipterygia]|nr:hypothetical protein C8R44DRAFT_725359 [Mycena epipterygia]
MSLRLALARRGLYPIPSLEFNGRMVMSKKGPANCIVKGEGGGVSEPDVDAKEGNLGAVDNPEEGNGGYMGEGAVRLRPRRHKDYARRILRDSIADEARHGISILPGVLGEVKDCCVGAAGYIVPIPNATELNVMGFREESLTAKYKGPVFSTDHGVEIECRCDFAPVGSPATGLEYAIGCIKAMGDVPIGKGRGHLLSKSTRFRPASFGEARMMAYGGFFKRRNTAKGGWSIPISKKAAKGPGRWRTHTHLKMNPKTGLREEFVVLIELWRGKVSVQGRPSTELEDIGIGVGDIDVERRREKAVVGPKHLPITALATYIGTKAVSGMG